MEDINELTRLDPYRNATIPAEAYRYAFDHRSSHDRFCCYIDKFKDELILRYFAFKDTNKSGFKIIEVGRRSPYIKGWMMTKNIRYNYIAGYHAVYDKPKECLGTYDVFEPYQYDEWYHEPIQNYYAPCINAERLKEFDEFRYCGYSGDQAIGGYLEAYLENHAVEFFGKLHIRFSKVLLNKCKKDKQFRSFIIKNAAEVNLYGVQATIEAYKRHISIEQARRDCAEANRFRWEVSRWYPSIKDSGLDLEKVKKYIYNHYDCSTGSYSDYLRACIELGLDLNDTKNSFPNDFRRMHDLRTLEYQSKKKKGTLESQLKMDEEFNAVAAGLSNYTYTDGKYMVVIPMHVQDLVREGQLLNHCVGRMGYDQKMIKGISFICFVRRIEKPNVPLVTVEYDPKNHRVLQRYGKHDSKPSEKILEFIKKWEDKIKNEKTT